MRDSQHETTTFARCTRRTLALVLAFLPPCCASAPLRAQEITLAQPPSAAPPLLPHTQGNAGIQPVQTAASASLSGSVLDQDDAAVPGARVALRGSNGEIERTLVSDREGRFTLPNLRPDTYSITVTAPGFANFTSQPLPIQAGETRASVNLALSILSAHTDISVSVPREELATAEIHEQEQQRIVGFPDFYTSFRWDAQPLDAGQKFSLATHATTDPMAFVTAGLVAGGEQIENTFPSWGKGAGGYARRYGAAYTDAFVGKFLGGAVLPTIFREDPRYFYMGPGRGTIRQRARHAILSAIIARGDNGRPEPNYAHVFGNASAGALSTLYHPATDSAGKLALDNALLGTAGEAGVNLVREFLLKRFTHGLPANSSSR